MLTTSASANDKNWVVYDPSVSHLRTQSVVINCLSKIPLSEGMQHLISQTLIKNCFV